MKRLSLTNKVVVALIPVLVGAVPTVVQAAKAQPNAYDFYLRAGKALDYTGEGSDFPNFNDPKLNAPFRSPLARREVVLRHNARALSIMREGFQYSYFTPPYKGSSFFPSYARLRDLARILSVEADVHAVHGRYNKAISSGLDAIRLGTDVPRGGALIASLVGVAIESIGVSNLKKSYIEKLDAHSALILAQRLETLDAHRVSYSQTLQNEKAFGVNQLRETFKSSGWRKQYRTPQTPAQITRTYNRLMDEAIINAALAYPQRRGVVAEDLDTVNQDMLGIFLSDNAAKPSYAGSGIFVERSRAKGRLTATMLALRAYKVEVGHYPATLSELAPKYLRRVPLDPFSNNQPLRYKTTGIEYSLYSIGYDGVDDDGKALPKRARPDAKGDIVAGINTR
jgi:hypothetical protein